MRWKLVCSLVSIYFDNLELPYNKSKLYKTLDYWSRGMLNFNCSEKSPPPHFVHDFHEKCFSFYILLTDQISLSYCL